MTTREERKYMLRVLMRWAYIGAGVGVVMTILLWWTAACPSH